MLRSHTPLWIALAAASAGLLLSAPTPGADAPSSPPPAGDARPAEAGAGIPVKEVVLFSSGVGYFEHDGVVNGSGDTELRFKTQQINDILKSLVLQDLDKGRVTAVTYPSQDPIAKTLRSFQVDINANPSLGDLLNQLRGARVKIKLGGEALEGTILGLEKKQRPAGPDHAVIESWFLNLLNDGDLRSIDLDAVQSVDLENPELRDELHKALAALAQARDQDKKPVRIHFDGQGKRRIRIGYVVETPVWKTSYRLLLTPPAAGAGAAAKPDHAFDAPFNSTPPPAEKKNAAAAPAAQDAKIQGWAIVENQTDNDWNDVELSLVSGRPISFIEDLYQPLYIPRPLVQPELYASLRPQTYSGGIEEAKAPEAFDAVAAPGAAPMAAAAMPPMAHRGAMQNQAMARMQFQDRAGDDQLKRAGEAEGLDAAASIASVASASKIGELFQYTVGSVSLQRQRSAMIPIITDPIEAERVSIYNASVLPRNPLNGARLKNTTGKHLLGGPITVFDNNVYAGDASIDNLPPGQERLISYGVDLQVLVDATKSAQADAVLDGKIVKGVLYITRKHVFSQDYLLDNKSDHAKTLIVEHPVRPGWDLVDSPKPIETTNALYRFKGVVPAGKTDKLTVKQQRIDSQEIALLPIDVTAIESFRRLGPIPEPVKAALAKAAAMKSGIVDLQRQLQEARQQLSDITSEQSRIRDNMKTVDTKSDYYNRLLKKLNEQETSIETIEARQQTLQQKLDEQQKALEAYLGGLSVP